MKLVNKSEINTLKSILLHIKNDEYFTWEDVYAFDKAQFKQPTWQMLLHVFNHGTYHRGQLVNMLRQLGVSRIPATDFALWSRGKK